MSQRRGSNLRQQHFFIYSTCGKLLTKKVVHKGMADFVLGYFTKTCENVAPSISLINDRQHTLKHEVGTALEMI